MNDKSKLQIIENTRLYASENSRLIAKDMNNTRDDIYDLAGKIFKDPRSVDELVNGIETSPNRPDQKGREVADKVIENPDRVGKLNEKLDPNAVKELGGKFERLGNLITTDRQYNDLWKEAVEARKAKPGELDDKISSLNSNRRDCDAARDSRLPGREWSPHADSQRYLDKGLQMTPEEREKQREMSIERGDKDPFER